MIKNGYYGNECFDLARDRIKVRQIASFITTKFVKYIDIPLFKAVTLVVYGAVIN